MHQPGYGYYPPRYPQAGQYPAYPAAPATAAVSPLKAELKQAQEQLSAKSGELDAARSQLDQLQGKLQDCLAADARLTNELDYSTREQQSLRLRVTELLSTLNTAKATLDQQHQLINDHQALHRELSTENDQLHNELTGQDEQLAALQSELQTTTQALAEAQADSINAADALSAARQQIEAQRNALAELEAELARLVSRLQGEPPVPAE
jgi:chromosome segregation ATPase